MAEAKLESEALGTGGAPLTQKRESLFQDAFRRLLKNRASVIGGSYCYHADLDGNLCSIDRCQVL